MPQASFTEWDVNQCRTKGAVSVDPAEIEEVRPRMLRQLNGSHAPGAAIDLKDGRSIRVTETPDKVHAKLKDNEKPSPPGPQSPPRSTPRDVA